MKIAFHFDYMHPTIDINKNYALLICKDVLRVVLNAKNLNLYSKIFFGDLLLSRLASDIEKKGTSTTIKFNKEKFFKILPLWLEPRINNWCTLSEKGMDCIFRHNVFVICFESIDLLAAEKLDRYLTEKIPSYIGALEVDETSPIHWTVYSDYIGPFLRIVNKDLFVFWDGISEESKNTGAMEYFRSLPFNKLEYESLNGKHTIFDEFHDFEQAKRIAEWKHQFGSLLAFIADDVINKLGDSAPDLGNKLWAALKTFNEAETDEQFAQVSATCRRIIEYVSDQVFPPTNEIVDGRKLGTNQYRNRLLAFAEKEKKSDTNIDLITISTKTLSEQMEKLSNLVNKGVHSELYRSECRRCLLRTVLLLDDIASLKSSPFEIKIKVKNILR